MANNLYLVLGVSRDATPQQIKAAYRRRAKELHPDRAPRTDCEGFRELQEAYTVLSDPDSRRSHDARLKQSCDVRGPSPKGPPAAEPLRAKRGPGTNRTQISLNRSFQTHRPSFDELFDRFWGNFDGITRPKAESIESLTVDVPISAQEAAAGGAVRILVPARARCPSCRGHGAIGLYECWECGGHGSITAEFPVQLTFPGGIRNEWQTRLSLSPFGIENFYLTLRMRVTDEQVA